MRCLTVAVLGLAAALAGPAAAQAAPVAVNATAFNSFVTRVTAVKPFESATITNAGAGFHSLVWETPSAPGAAPGDQWQSVRTFTRAGAYRYYCSIHGSRGGRGMSGVVYVTANGLVPKPAIVAPSAPAVFSGATLRVTSTEPASAQGIIYHKVGVRYLFFGRLTRSVLGGFNIVHFTATATGRHISPGTYRITFSLVSGVRRSLSRTVGFVVNR
jgi:plastocyanin